MTAILVDEAPRLACRPPGVSGLQGRALPLALLPGPNLGCGFATRSAPQGTRRRDVPLVSISGDGRLHVHANEMGDRVRHRIPLTASWFTMPLRHVLRTPERELRNRLIASDLANPDIRTLRRRARGAAVERSRIPQMLRAALRRSFGSPRRTDPDLISCRLPLPHHWPFIKCRRCGHNSHEPLAMAF